MSHLPKTVSDHIPELPMENKEFSHCIVDHDCSNYVGSKSVGCEHSKTSNQDPHQHRSQKNTDPRHTVKEKDLNYKMIFSTFKDPEDVGYVGNHVGDEKANEIANHRISCPGCIIYFFNGEVEKLYCMILFL